MRVATRASRPLRVRNFQSQRAPESHPARSDSWAVRPAHQSSRNEHWPERGHLPIIQGFNQCTAREAMKIVEIREKTIPISSPIRNAYIDFSKMTLSLVAVVTDVIRDGKPVVGYGFNSNGRYGQGKLMRERFIPRLTEAAPDSLLDASGRNLDPHKIWAAMFTNEKPGGHGERSVAIGTIDMAVWDAVAKIEGKPLFQLLQTAT